MSYGIHCKMVIKNESMYPVHENRKAVTIYRIAGGAIDGV